MEPFKIFVDIGGVHHHKVVVSPAIKEDVVHDAAVGVAHGRILDLPLFQGSCIVHRHVLQECEGIGAVDPELTHVGHVEQSRGGAYGQVFGDDAGILDGHLESAEGGDSGIQCHVLVIKWGLFR
ncbi:hypothetical protein ES703_44633 [subsurface metagenome]